MPTGQGTCAVDGRAQRWGCLSPLELRRSVSEFKMSDIGGLHTSDLGLSFDLTVTAPWFFLPEGRKYLTCFCFYRKPQLYFVF